MKQAIREKVKKKGGGKRIRVENIKDFIYFSD